jgi:type II secretory pathway component GspD/PulD (secretin)
MGAAAGEQRAPETSTFPVAALVKEPAMRRLMLLIVVAVSLAFAPAPLPRAGKGKEKRFVVAVNGKTWREVFTWLSNASGKTIITSLVPAGTCTVTTPPGKRYTFNEIIDLLNDDLFRKEWPARFYLLPGAHDEIVLVSGKREARERLRRVAIKDLPRFPRTVPVSIVWEPKTLVAEDIVPLVQQMMGPFGNVIALPNRNRLVMEDQVRNLDRIIKVIQQLDGAKKR